MNKLGKTYRPELYQVYHKDINLTTIFRRIWFKSGDGWVHQSTTVVGIYDGPMDEDIDKMYKIHSTTITYLDVGLS